MITSWQIYWITRLDAIGQFLTTTYVLIILAGIVVSVLWFIRILTKDWRDDEVTNKVLRRLLKSLVVAFSINSLGWFLPSTKEMAAILVLPKIINNQKVQDIPEKVLDLATSWLEELKPKVNKK